MRAAVLALVLLGSTFGFAGSALADRWSAPFRVAGPMSLDLLPAELAFAPGGAVAAGFAAQDEDNPANAQAFTVVRSARGRIGRVAPVAGAQSLLDLAYDGSTLKLLTAVAPDGQVCCTAAQVVSVGANGHRLQSPVTGSLFGATLGRLLVLARHVTVTALAAENGVWVERNPVRGGRVPGPPHRLTGAAEMPNALGAAALSGGRSVVAWTASPGPAVAPRAITVARGSPSTAPSSPRVVLRVAPGHEIDELQVAGGSTDGTVAYVESWFDRTGAFHSRVAVADLKPPVRAHVFALPRVLAAGAALSADARGDQMLTWKACDALASCRVEAVGRTAGKPFGAVSGLGATDASQSPAGAVGPNGEAVVGWVSNGHVFAAEQPQPGARFAPVHRVSATSYASDLTLGFGPRAGAMAAWTQGTLNSSVMAATLR